jgi:hypothetical protein
MLKTDTIQIKPELLAFIAENDEFKGAWRPLGTLAPERPAPRGHHRKHRLLDPKCTHPGCDSTPGHPRPPLHTTTGGFPLRRRQSFSGRWCSGIVHGEPRGGVDPVFAPSRRAASAPPCYRLSVPPSCAIFSAVIDRIFQRPASRTVEAFHYCPHDECSP